MAPSSPGSLDRPASEPIIRAGVSTITQGEVRLKTMATDEKLTIEIEYCVV
jgi:hypothetical protein